MNTIWRAKCKHRDVRVNGDFGLRKADGSPRWDPCLVCDAKWRRYEVVETVTLTHHRKDGSGCVRVTKRTLRRLP